MYGPEVPDAVGAPPTLILSAVQAVIVPSGPALAIGNGRRLIFTLSLEEQPKESITNRLYEVLPVGLTIGLGIDVLLIFTPGVQL